MRMSADILFHNPAFKTALALEQIAPDDDELAELIGADGNMHVVMTMAAQMIGAAIRECFGLPPKED
jgi:hypothetical protein